MDLIVVRLAATSGDFAPSKPCRDCLQELKRAQVHRVTYTTGCRDVLCATEKVSCMNEEEAIVTSKRQEMELLRLRDKKNKII